MTNEVRAYLLDQIEMWKRVLEQKKTENINLKTAIRKLEHKLGRPKELEDKDRRK